MIRVARRARPDRDRCPSSAARRLRRGASFSRRLVGAVSTITAVTSATGVNVYFGMRMLAYRLQGERPRFERHARRRHLVARRRSSVWRLAESCRQPADRARARRARLPRLRRLRRPPRPRHRPSTLGRDASVPRWELRSALEHEPRALVRGIQLIVGITLATFAVPRLPRHPAASRPISAPARATSSPGWLALAARLALQEGVCGGLRIFALGRVLSKELRLRTAIVSEFVLMFCAGVTPAQAGAPALAGRRARARRHALRRRRHRRAPHRGVHDHLLPRVGARSSSSSARPATSSSAAAPRSTLSSASASPVFGSGAPRARPLRRVPAARSRASSASLAVPAARSCSALRSARRAHPARLGALGQAHRTKPGAVRGAPAPERRRVPRRLPRLPPPRQARLPRRAAPDVRLLLLPLRRRLLHPARPRHPHRAEPLRHRRPAHRPGRRSSRRSSTSRST